MRKYYKAMEDALEMAKGFERNGLNYFTSKQSLSDMLNGIINVAVYDGLSESNFKKLLNKRDEIMEAFR